MNIFQSNNKTVINGIEINVPKGSNISIVGNKIYVDGKPYINDKLVDKEIVQIIINGDVGNIECDVDIDCNNVNGNIKCGRDIDIRGDVTGDVSAGRDIDCKKINGNARAGRDISY